MIPWNYNIYGITTDDYMSGAETVSIGTLLATDTYQYFNTTGKPLYSADCSVKLDDTVFLWHIGNNSAFATNSAWCVEKSDTLNLQVVSNKVDKAPFGLQLCNVGSESFKRYPKGRMCYDYWSYLWFNYVNSRLFVDINRTKFCMRPRPYVYDKNLNSIVPQSVQSVANYINSDPENRFIAYINLELYHGDEYPRTTDKTYIHGTSLLGSICGDVLTDRPVPENATGAKTDMLYDFRDVYNADWRTDKQYSPFAQAYSGLWYSGDLSSDNPINIGFMQNRSVSNIRNGSYSPAHGDKVTGGFIKFNDAVQDFEDVSYKWSVKAYYVEGGVFLENGFPLDTLPNGHNIRFFTSLEVIDKKGLSAGAALQAAVKHECAYVGFYFADTLDDAQNTQLGIASNRIYLPEIIGGTTTGRYFTGDDIPNVPYANSTSVSDEAFQYKPEFTPEEGENGDFNSLTNSGTIGSGVSYYALKTAQANALCTWLNTTYLPNDQDEFIQDFKGENPSDYITAMLFYPFDIPLTTGSDEQLVVGKLNAGSAYGRRLNYTYGTEYNYGSYTFPRFGDFRDMLMKISVFIPFCGKCDLDPRLWAGRTMTVKMSIDFPTGACTAKLYRDNFVLETISGTVGVPLPLSSVQNGSYQVSITNLLAAHKSAYRQQVLSTLGVAGGAIGAIGGAMSGNLAVMAGSLIGMTSGSVTAGGAAEKMENIDYNIDHTAPTVAEIQGGSPFLNCGNDHRVSIFICVPKFLPGYNAASYGKTTGYATCKQGVLSSVSKGFTRCSSANLSGIAATSTEKQMIFNLLQGGVIV